MLLLRSIILLTRLIPFIIMLEQFLQYLQYEKRYSQHTVISYRTDLCQFSEYLYTQYEISDLSQTTHLMVRSWFVSLIEHKISARTVNRKKTTLKTYFKFLRKQGILSENPMTKVITAKTSKRLPTFVEEDKMLEMLDHPIVKSKDEFTLVRDHLVLEMFYATGIRLSELVNLKEPDVNLYNSTIKVLGKRNKERIIPFTNHLKILIEQYLKIKHREIEINKDDNHFFVTATGKKVYQKLIYRVVNYYLSTVTTKDKKSPHVLRHTFATHMLNHGADLNSIKELLGHANLAATQIYTHNTIEKLKTVYKQSHPKA